VFVLQRRDGRRRPPSTWSVIMSNAFGHLADLLKNAWGAYRPSNTGLLSPAGREALRVKGAELCWQSLCLVQEADAAARAAGLPNREVGPALSLAQGLMHALFYGDGRLADDFFRTAINDLRGLSDRLAKFASPPAAEGRPATPGRRVTTQALMADLVQRQPECIAWTQKQVAEAIGRSESSVRDSWHVVTNLQQLERLRRRG
jgi:hypothetical protein